MTIQRAWRTKHQRKFTAARQILRNYNLEQRGFAGLSKYKQSRNNECEHLRCETHFTNEQRNLEQYFNK